MGSERIATGNTGLWGCQICTGCGKCAGRAGDMDILICGVSEQILSDKSGEAKAAGYIAAVDIGTTTIAMLLRRTADGTVLDSYTAVNPQRSYGLDVMSRILAAQEKEKAQEMQTMVQQILDAGVRKFRATLLKSSEEYSDMTMAVAANTTMIYLLLGLDVKELAAAPFAAGFLSEVTCEISGLKAVILPGISAFIGADIAAGIYALSMNRKENLTLLADLGTNGELVLGCRDRLLTTSTAAGPAFEGSGADGYAADKAALIAQLIKRGFVDESGLLSDLYFDEGVTIEGVLITQADIRQFQMAKGAICAGIHLLMKRYGVDQGQIEQLYLAGGFGCYLSVEAAEETGLLPGGFAGKTTAVGNTALEGAFLYVRDKILGELTMPMSFANVEHMNLAMQADFNEIFMNHLNFE